MRCSNEIEQIIPKVNCQFGSSCGLGGIYQPSAQNRRFHLSGDFYDAIKNTQSLLTLDINGNITKFEEATEFICKSTHAEVYIFY